MHFRYRRYRTSCLVSEFRCPVTTAVLRGLGKVRQFVRRLCDLHAASVSAEASLINENAISAGVRDGP
jgi:hypothetical protein